MTLICRIELIKQDGMTLHVEDAQSGVTQKVELKDSSIKLTVKGQDESSKNTLQLNQQGLTVQCKKFILKAEEIHCESKQKSHYKSGQAMKIHSKGALDVTADTHLTQKAKGNVKLAATAAGQLNLQTSGVATLKGSIVQVQGKVNLG